MFYFYHYRLNSISLYLVYFLFIQYHCYDFFFLWGGWAKFLPINYDVYYLCNSETKNLRYQLRIVLGGTGHSQAQVSGKVFKRHVNQNNNTFIKCPIMIAGLHKAIYVIRQWNSMHSTKLSKQNKALIEISQTGVFLEDIWTCPMIWPPWCWWDQCP